MNAETIKEVVKVDEKSNKTNNRKNLIRRSKWNKEAVVGLVLALLPLIGFLIFSGFPLIISFLGLFCDIDLYNIGSISWNNFEGFKVIFKPEYSIPTYGLDMAHYFYRACGITVWLATTQIITLVIALGISVLLATKVRGHKIFQILFFVPYICSTVAVTLMWGWIFSGETSGVLNSIFGTSQKWLEDPSTMTWTIMVAIIWQAPGYGIVMYKAALANIDASQYEAAALDGANAWQKFRYVTLPGVAPTTFYLLIAGISAGLLTYDVAALLIPDGWTGNIGGNESMGLTLVRLVYYFISNDQLARSTVSSAAVISWCLFIAIAIITFVLFRRREKSMED